MRIDHPAPRHMLQLRQLWQDTFGDTDDFLDSFYCTAYFPERCRCVLEDDRIAAVLYWIDCMIGEQKLAYIYAVATCPDHRGRGLCRQLMENTHELLRARGYSGTVLVPQQEPLRQMYEKLGYENAGGLAEFHCTAADVPVSLRAVGPTEFAALRRNLLSPGAVIQEGAGLAFLAEQLQFYAGGDFLLAAYAENDTLHGVELLGNRNAAPGILRALNLSHGQFRIPGAEKPFAMFHPLAADAKKPDYLGFAFD